MKAGDVRVFRCRKCDGLTVTVIRAPGTLMPALGCKATAGCDGHAVVIDTLDADVSGLTPTWEWYRPSRGWAFRQDRRYPGSKEHWLRGGLWPRVIPARAPWEADPDAWKGSP